MDSPTNNNLAAVFAFQKKSKSIWKILAYLIILKDLVNFCKKHK